MQWIAGAALVCALTLSSAMAAEPSPDVREQVSQAEKQWVDAVLQPNRAALDRLLADDIVYAHSSGLIQTKAQFIDSVLSPATHYQSIDFTDTAMRQYGDTVIVNHKATFQNLPTGVSHLFVTMVWVRQNGQWKLASRHASKLTQ